MSTHDWESVIQRHLDGVASPEEVAELSGQLESDANTRMLYLRMARIHAALAAEELDEPSSRGDGVRPCSLTARPSSADTGRWRLQRVALSVAAAAAVVVLITGVFFLGLSGEPRIATITGLNGAVQWTGDGGRVVYELGVGKGLSGGTIEGTTPHSWFEFEYDDGSAIMISGISSLTFSDRGQKILHLKEGKMTADVAPQPASKPMLIYTPDAILEVVGTKFEAAAKHTSTVLKVNEGKVRIRRINDGSSVDVPAQYQVVVVAGQEMRLVPVPKATTRWKSQLPVGPEGLYGKWFPRTTTEEARLRTIPCTTHKGVPFYMAAIEVSRGNRPPVILQPGSHLQVKGQIESPEDVYFGVSVQYPNGGFAGRFGTKRPATGFRSDKGFDMLLDLADFQLDVTLAEIKDIVPETPFYLIVDTIWCLTLDRQAGLEVLEMELLPPGMSENSVPIEGLQPPITDIWTAASQGDLETIRQHLAAGVDADILFVIPGVPGSGATPLHIAVLSDQRKVAQFLIDQGANVNAKAQDKYGGTPLHLAAALGRYELAEILIHAGADVMSRDNNGRTPLDCTTLKQFPASKARLDIAQLLRKSISEQ